MKTTFKSALALMINEAMERHGLPARDIDMPHGLMDAEVLDALIYRIEQSDLSDEEKEGLADWLAHLVAAFPPTEAPAGEA